MKRIIRKLVYEGSDGWINGILENNVVKKDIPYVCGSGFIRETELEVIDIEPPELTEEG